MIGRYRNGCGQAHKHCAQHDIVFNCRMLGTFNVDVEDLDLRNHLPIYENDNARYWLVIVNGHRAWAIRNHTSRLPWNRLELLTKSLLPDYLKKGNLVIAILERWNDERIGDWGVGNYQFQTFDWHKSLKADSQMVWDALFETHWSGKSVLDIGSHYGYYSFKAAKAGAEVVAFEPDDMPRRNGMIIGDQIEMSDVVFVDKEPAQQFDIILYMSVHHQPDPQYSTLEHRLAQLRNKAKEKLIVELIMPPMFGRKYDEPKIDAIVGGRVLLRYKHRVRGIRKLYEVLL